MAGVARFTAIVKIVRIDEVDQRTPGSSGRTDTTKVDKDTELASLVVRSSDFEKLIVATKKHLDLVEEQ